ncbi:MAG: aminotransferase class I/II-fold pyridoxal phosphate-dependent enzyme [Cyanobacteria bacterium HKST-UBA06]|nr:aminotransferase class I/II-fold pyridoxal phosphate-dependent enzyme [Cyanobacteria bacterium HKST-UBA04]MCA9807067.1 aminotransferase class I/II-fold pyridoxal phosphate-dependent enzyme [Cyanobacteria bacterium HKST-UBA06]MCA9840488.1 aminotransferase class I/II-fold pyridoxal phosphate-dependent enzyme [Cyanobacteria bacterium HKST-UBA03]
MSVQKAADTPLAIDVEPSSYLTRMPLYVFAWLDELKAAARAKGQTYIDLGIGSPNLPIPEPVQSAIREQFNGNQQSAYPPFVSTQNFRQAVVDWMQRRFGVGLNPETEVLTLSGSKEGLAQLAIAYVTAGGLSIVPDIYYPVHSRATWMMGGEVFHVPITEENGFLPVLEDIPEEVAKRARLFYVNYPNNPTGAVADLGYYRELVAFCRQHHIILASDMAYCEMTFDGYKAPSVLEVEGAKSLAIEYYSFSKSFSMAGCRLGFAVGNAEIIHAVYSCRTNMGYGTPRSIQEGGAVALNNAETFVEPMVRAYEGRRKVISEGFSSLGWTVPLYPATMYVWLKVPDGFTSESWTCYLLDKAGVVVTPGHAFGQGGNGFFRISLVADEAVLQQAVDRIRQAGITFTSTPQ